MSPAVERLFERAGMLSCGDLLPAKGIAMTASHAKAPYRITPADPAHPGPSGLLAQSHALMQSLYTPEENFHLDLEALRAPDIRFFAAFDEKACLGTGALALRDGYGEVKSMFVADSARGRGVADAILQRLEAEARILGLTSLKLETGVGLDAAHRLYARHGFVRSGPFGDYPEAPASVFLEKQL